MKKATGGVFGWVFVGGMLLCSYLLLYSAYALVPWALGLTAVDQGVVNALLYVMLSTPIAIALSFAHPRFEVENNSVQTVKGKEGFGLTMRKTINQCFLFVYDIKSGANYIYDRFYTHEFRIGFILVNLGMWVLAIKNASRVYNSESAGVLLLCTIVSSIFAVILCAWYSVGNKNIQRGEA